MQTQKHSWSVPVSEKVLRDAVAKAPEALDELLEACDPIVRDRLPALMRRAWLKGDHLSDLAQDTLVGVLLNIDKFKPRDEPEAEFGAWLRKVALNRVFRLARATSHPGLRLLQADLLAEVAADTGALPASFALRRGEDISRIQAEVEQLPEESQELLRLRYVEGMKCGEICRIDPAQGQGETEEALKKREEVVKKRLTRIRTKLNECLGDPSRFRSRFTKRKRKRRSGTK